MNPKVTVLMPVYNGQKYLKEAIESILNQTFADFEFLIIDDGSTDNSAKIIESFADARIKLVHNEANLGLIKTLNKGLDMSKGKYIARMDCDDISLPKRLAIQVKFMENNPEVGVCGSWVEVIGLEKKFINEYPKNHEDIRAYLLFATPFAHPSVIIRKEIVEKYNLKYDENYKHAEDYELWSKVVNYSKLASIAKVLLLYRMHPESVSKNNSSIQIENSNRIRLKLLEKLNIIPTATELELHRRFIHPKSIHPKDFIIQLEKWLIKILAANKEAKIYDQKSLASVIASRWFNACDANTGLGFWIFRKFWQSPLRKLKAKDFGQTLKFATKSLLKKSRLN